MLPPLQIDLRPFDLESGVRVTCDVDYLYANFSLPRPLCSRLRPDVRDRDVRQTDVRRALSLNAPTLGRRHNNQEGIHFHYFLNGLSFLSENRKY